MTMDDFEDLENTILGLPIPATPRNVKLAREFVFKKWKERAADLGRPEPKDLSDSCKFTSQFARIVFGGELQGNEKHQFIRLDDGRILDLNRYADDVRKRIAEPHVHDPKFFGNPDHEESMASCRASVIRWIEEFVQILKDRYIDEAASSIYVRHMVDLREADSGLRGLFVGVKFSPRTVQNLIDWSNRNMTGDSIQSPDEYHTTVILSRDRKFPYDIKRWSPPLVIPASSLKFAIFGYDDPVLVVKYESVELSQRHWKARTENNLSWDFPEYCPHVTLSDHKIPWKGSINDLEPIGFDLEIVSEYVEDFE